MIFDPRTQPSARAAISLDRDQTKPPKMFSYDLVEGSIALLSDPEIGEMPREDLLDVMQIVNAQRHRANRQAVADLDDASLRRVLLLLRRSLRAQIDLQSRGRGWTPYFGERA